MIKSLLIKNGRFWSRVRCLKADAEILNSVEVNSSTFYKTAKTMAQSFWKLLNMKNARTKSKRR